MSLYYLLFGKPFTTKDHGRKWREEGITEVVFRLEPGYQGDCSGGKRTHKAVAYAGDKALVICEYPISSDAIERKDTVELMLDVIARAARKIDRCGLKCTMYGQSVEDYIKTEKFYAYVSGLM